LNRELSPPFPPHFLVLRMLVLRMSDCSSPTLTTQLGSGKIMRSSYWTRFYSRSATPGCRSCALGDLVVHTGWRQRGRSMNFPSFFCISLKGWRRMVHQVVRKGQGLLGSGRRSNVTRSLSNWMQSFSIHEDFTIAPSTSYWPWTRSESFSTSP
jgi:hypothetical protein